VLLRAEIDHVGELELEGLLRCSWDRGNRVRRYEFLYNRNYAGLCVLRVFFML
jgi:hypothetical protein